MTTSPVSGSAAAGAVPVVDNEHGEALAGALASASALGEAVAVDGGGEKGVDAASTPLNLSEGGQGLARVGAVGGVAGESDNSKFSSAAAFVEAGLQDVDEDACSICLDTFSANDPAAPTQCRHSFHLQCVLEWAQRSKDCPMCLRTLVMKDPDSQDLLEACAQERAARAHAEAMAQQTHVHFPRGALEELALLHQRLASMSEDPATESSMLEMRLMQHLAAAAAAGMGSHPGGNSRSQRLAAAQQQRQQQLLQQQGRGLHQHQHHHHHRHGDRDSQGEQQQGQGGGMGMGMGMGSIFFPSSAAHSSPDNAEDSEVGRRHATSLPSQLIVGPTSSTPQGPQQQAGAARSPSLSAGSQGPPAASRSAGHADTASRRHHGGQQSSASAAAAAHLLFAGGTGGAGASGSASAGGGTSAGTAAASASNSVVSALASFAAAFGGGGGGSDGATNSMGSWLFGGGHAHAHSHSHSHSHFSSTSSLGGSGREHAAVGRSAAGARRTSAGGLPGTSVGGLPSAKLGGGRSSSGAADVAGGQPTTRSSGSASTGGGGPPLLAAIAAAEAAAAVQARQQQNQQVPAGTSAAPPAPPTVEKASPSPSADGNVQMHQSAA